MNKLACTLARVNYLNVPVSKVYNTFESEMSKALNVAFEDGNDTTQIINELDLTTLKMYDIRKEYNQFVKIANKLNAPKVFGHGDFRSNNILVQNDGQVKLIDLEYSSYSSRGTDYGMYLLEWGRDTFNYVDFKMPSDSVLTTFLTSYSKKCDQLVPGFSSKAENSIESMLKEVKLGILFQFIFAAVFFLKLKESFVATLPFDKKANLVRTFFAF